MDLDTDMDIPSENIRVEIPRKSRRLLGIPPSYKGLSIYKLASTAYLTSLTKGET